MKIKRSNRFALSLESVAMTDIVMNLFIFFFMSFSLLYTFNPNKEKESKIEVKLPSGSSAPTQTQDQEGPLVVTVTSGNEIFINKTRVLPQMLSKELEKRANSAKVTGLVVRSDKLASVDTLVKVLDAAKISGIQKLGVAIEQSGA